MRKSERDRITDRISVSTIVIKNSLKSRGMALLKLIVDKNI